MEIAGLLVVLAVIGGLIVAPIVLRDTSWMGERPPPPEAPEDVPVRAEWPIDTVPAEPRRRGRRRVVSASALTAALAVEGEEDPRPSFFGRTLAFGRLLLVIVFITALAGGTFFLLATTIASKMHFHPS